MMILYEQDYYNLKQFLNFLNKHNDLSIVKKSFASPDEGWMFVMNIQYTSQLIQYIYENINIYKLSSMLSVGKYFFKSFAPF